MKNVRLVVGVILLTFGVGLLTACTTNGVAVEHGEGVATGVDSPTVEEGMAAGWSDGLIAVNMYSSRGCPSYPSAVAASDQGVTIELARPDVDLCTLDLALFYFTVEPPEGVTPNDATTVSIEFDGGSVDLPVADAR